MSVHTTFHDWADSMSDWAHEHADELKAHQAHRAQPLPKEWPTRRAFVPQGCTQQGRHEPTIPVVIDRLPEAFDRDDQSQSADMDVLLWLIKGLAVVLLACFSAWCIASYWVMTNV